MNRNRVLNSIDWVSVFIYLFLIALGWMNIYSVTAPKDGGEFIDMSQKYFKQIVWIGFALLLLVTILFIDSKFFQAFSYVFYGLSIASLLLVLVIGSEIKGAKSWITIGSFSIQPAEFAKFAAALAVSKLLTGHNFNLLKIKNTVLAFAVFMFPAVLILLQNDTGSAMVYVIFALPLFREGLSGNYLIAAVLAALYFIFSIVYSETMVYVFVVLLTMIYLFFKKEYMHLYVSAISLAFISGIWALLKSFDLIQLEYKWIITIYAWMLSGYYFVHAIVKRTMK